MPPAGTAVTSRHDCVAISSIKAVYFSALNICGARGGGRRGYGVAGGRNGDGEDGGWRRRGHSSWRVPRRIDARASGRRGYGVAGGRCGDGKDGWW
jgi:hypothetical protein